MFQLGNYFQPTQNSEEPACDSVGCRYILVDSKKESISFYEKYGFKLAEKNKKKDISPMYFNMQPIVAKLKLEKKAK